MLYVGTDPGTSNNMAVAVILPDDSIRALLVEPGAGKEPRDRAPHVLSSLRDKFMGLGLPRGHSVVLALEWQRPLKGDPNPKNICDLAAFAGIALASMQVLVENLSADRAHVYTPLPEEWKGQVDKHVKQNRIVAAAGLSRVTAALKAAGVPVPSNLGRFEATFGGKAGDIIDAIGLAQWAREKTRLRELIQKATLRPS